MGQKDTVWHRENLDKYLKNPKEYAPGGNMPFIGMNNPQERSDLIRFLYESNPRFKT